MRTWQSRVIKSRNLWTSYYETTAVYIVSNRKNGTLYVGVTSDCIGLFDDIFLDCHVLIQPRFTADVVFRPRKDDREIFHPTCPTTCPAKPWRSRKKSGTSRIERDGPTVYFLKKALMFFLISLFFLIPPLHADTLTFTTTQDGITLNAHIMQPEECTKLFLHDLHAYHICPVQLTITNTTSKFWMISGNSIEELALIAPHTIARDIIFQYTTTATITAYGCALTGWIGTIAGFNIVHEYLPELASSTKYISAGAALLSFLYKARMFALYHSDLYAQTHAQIMQYGLSARNNAIHPTSSLTHVMFLNDKSYEKPPTHEHTFFYFFTVKLYNMHDSSDTLTFTVEIPKIYEEIDE